MKRVWTVWVAVCYLLIPSTALAYNPLSDACSNNGAASTTAACTASTGNPFVGPNGVLGKVSLILAFIASVVAVIIILVSAFNYVTSGGDAKKAADARSGIVGALVGLVIIAASASIVTFVVRNL